MLLISSAEDSDRKMLPKRIMGIDMATAARGELIMVKKSNIPKNTRKIHENHFLTFDETEIMLLVADYYLQEIPATEIVTLMRENFGVRISSRAPFKYLCQAIRKGLVVLQAPDFLLQRAKLHQAHPWLEGVEVVHSIANRHVSQRGARVLQKLIKQLVTGTGKKKTVHIGWGGGLQIRDFASCFVHLMNEEPEGWPEKIYVHGMVPGVGLSAPTLDPSSIFMEFMNEYCHDRIKFQFVQFPGPVLFDSTKIDVDELQSDPDTRMIMAEALELDIIVSSAANWEDQHSVFRQGMESSSTACKLLEMEGVMGDILFRPVNECGPIEVDTRWRFQTLLELAQLPQYISTGGKVMLLVGPCNECSLPKIQILKALLAHHEHLFTHLIVDSHTARGVQEFAA